MIDRDEGVLLEDQSGTLISIEGGGPQTTAVPTESLVRRTHELAYKRPDLDLNGYLEQVFRGKGRWFPPHRYFSPWTNAFKRTLGMDSWHALSRDEIMNADISKAHPDSLKSMEKHFLNEEEADDLVQFKGMKIAGSGIMYEDRLAAFGKMGRARSQFDWAVFREDFDDTGLEVKWVLGKFFRARYPGIHIIARDDCRLTALAMTGVADVVSVVSNEADAASIHEEMRVLQATKIPDYMPTDLTRLRYGRLRDAFT